jgi:hypothetical protein
MLNIIVLNIALSDIRVPVYIGYALQQNGYSKEAEYYYKRQLEISGKINNPELWIDLSGAYARAGV